MAGRVRRLAAAELQEMLDRGQSDLVIIDVRDDDFEGGHIPGAVNVPSADFAVRAPQLVDKYRHHSTVVFHCMLSQLRGPTCASVFAQLLALDEDAKAQVYVLGGGFRGWLSRFYESRPDLIAGRR